MDKILKKTLHFLPKTNLGFVLVHITDDNQIDIRLNY